MRILLAHNSTYYPSHGGGDKSNRLLMEALAERGHDVRVVTRVERFGPEDHGRLLRELEKRGLYPETSDPNSVRMKLNGVDVRVLTTSPNLRGFFAQHIAEFDPDIIVTSTDDPAQLLFDLAVRASRARVVYLVRATIAVPFGPEASTQNTAKTLALRSADGVVAVSHYVAGYVRKWGGMDAIHVPISLLDKSAEYPYLGSIENRFVSMVNPCAVKGIGIFLELADRMPDVEFAAVPTWGTTRDDLDALERRGNITVLPPFDNIDDLLRITKVMLVPSVWAEARSRLLMEAMSRGVPVIASDIGGLHEAHLGVDYLIPITPITHYQPRVDMNMVPVADVPPQNVDPWERTLRRLLDDRQHFDELSAKSREAGLAYINNLNILPFEAFLEELRSRPKKEAPVATGHLTEEKKKLLALRLRQRSAVAKPTWFSGLEEHKVGRLLLFCFPYAGGGTMRYSGWRQHLSEAATVCAVRLPGRESRLDEPPVDRMGALVDALASAILPHLETPFAFFGHSMGAAIAFELARRLRAEGKPLPRALYASAARAPQFRLNRQPPPEPSEEALIEELCRLEGMPREILTNSDLMQFALPALRADARLYRNYTYEPGEPFAFPIFSYGGSTDPNVRPEHLEKWREQTTGPFRRREFPGGHFYIHSSQEFLSAFAEDLKVSPAEARP
jgi:surfactin synthase thioesterase subunit/glycosyltransferase involved in cell wall biosynthesis